MNDIFILDYFVLFWFVLCIFGVVDLYLSLMMGGCGVVVLFFLFFFLLS